MAHEHLPLVALVGRPNVGKSTLFNRLVGRRAALVDNQPGVTRDRLFGLLRHEGRLFRIVDTGGFDPRPGDTLLASVREQTQLAIDEADLVLLVLDSDAGLCTADQEIARLLHRAGKPTIAVANKVDDPRHEPRIAELYGLGIEPLVPVSAEHGRGVGELCDLLSERLAAPVVAEVEQEAAPLPVAEGDLDAPSVVEWAGGPVNVAVIGRPNAGKSSLVNRLLGEKRMLESEVPGTTRDAIDTELVLDGQPFVLIDTAGIRRKRSIAERVERFAVMAAMRSIERADVAVVVLDAGEPPAEQESRIAHLAAERGKGVILVANKWDLVSSSEAGREWIEQVRRRLPAVWFAALVRTSAKSGRGVDRLLPAVLEAQRERHRRVGTSELNRFFREVVEAHPPPVRAGRRPRLFFVSQPLVRPPTFVFAARSAEDIPSSYGRYLQNALRERYGFTGTPVWLKFRGRRDEAPKGKRGRSRS